MSLAPVEPDREYWLYERANGRRFITMTDCGPTYQDAVFIGTFKGRPSDAIELILIPSMEDVDLGVDL